MASFPLREPSRRRWLPPFAVAAVFVLMCCCCKLHVYHHVIFEHGDGGVVVETDVGPLEFSPDLIIEVTSNG